MNISLITTSEKSTILVNAYLIHGESNFKEFEIIAEEIKKLNSNVVEIDLNKCTYMDTRAIAVFLEIHQALKKAGRILRFINVNDDMVDLLKAISLNKIIELN
jgi:anti-anti-sigma factor